MPGPIPKRDAERRRRNKDAVETTTVDIDALIAEPVEIPVPPTTYSRWVPVVDEETGRTRYEQEALDEPVPAWEPITISFWESFARSGQSIFYEPTDWMTAYALMEVLDRWLKPQEVKVGQIGSDRDAGGGGDVTYLFENRIIAMPGGTLTAILKGLSSLMATEGDRRRLRIELERKKARDAALTGDGTVVPISQARKERFS
jgi:hypothetical protein